MTKITTVPEISGVYKIENKNNGKVYIGSSKNIYKRWEVHKKGLEKKSHHNAKLQHAWNKSGGKLDLTFDVLEECPVEVLFEREQHWMDFYDSYNSGYNCTKKAQGAPEGVKMSVWVKTEPLLPEIFQNLYEFDCKRKDSKANDLWVSHFGLKIGKAESKTAFIGRLLKASRMLLWILEELEELDNDVEYRLHCIHYMGKNGGYEITPELNESRNSKYSQHNRVKTQRITETLWSEIQDCFKGPVGRGLKQRYELYLQGVDVDGE